MPVAFQASAPEQWEAAPSTEEETLCIRLRGLPFSAGEAEVRQFLAGVDVDQVLIRYGADGRPSGEAFVVLGSAEAAAQALTRHRSTIGHRYIEVFPSTVEDFNQAAQVTAAVVDGLVLKLRGLPWSTTPEDVAAFLAEYEVMPEAVLIGANAEGRPSGEAWVTFTSEDLAAQALAEKQGQQLGTRYVELFPSSQAEMIQVAGLEAPASFNAFDSFNAAAPMGGPPVAALRASKQAAAASAFPSPARRNVVRAASPSEPKQDGAGAPLGNRALRLRGLPFSATEEQIREFFTGYLLVRVAIITDGGRPTGEALVQLPSARLCAEAAAALQGGQMGDRYIELFPTGIEEFEAPVAPAKPAPATTPTAKTAAVPAAAPRQMPAAAPRRPLRVAAPQPAGAGSSVLRVSGLPVTAKPQDVIGFFQGHLVVKVMLLGARPGQPTVAEALVDFGSPDAAARALATCQYGQLASRCIILQPAGQQEMFAQPARSLPQAAAVAMTGAAPSVRSRTSMPTVLRLRGMPFGTTQQDVEGFFAGFQLAAIQHTTAPVKGKPSGEGYVAFASASECARALRDRQGAAMGRRYVELLPSTLQDMENAVQAHQEFLASLPGQHFA